MHANQSYIIIRLLLVFLCINKLLHCAIRRRYWDDADAMQKLGRAFQDMPGLGAMFGAPPAGGAARGVEGGEGEEEADTVESPFLAAAMEGDVEAVKKAIAEGGSGTWSPPV
jgi:hypothetical protein